MSRPAVWALVPLLLLASGLVLVGTSSAAPPATELGRAVERFVDVKGQPTEQRLAKFASFLEALPRSRAACEREPRSRPGLAKAIRFTSQAQINSVLFVEHGELGLYAAARRIPKSSARRQFVTALDRVGDVLDLQLDEAKADRQLAGKISSSCEPLAEGAALGRNWTAATEKAEARLAGLKLAYGAPPAARAGRKASAPPPYRVSVRLDKGNYESEVVYASDTGCSTSFVERDEFTAEASYGLRLAGAGAKLAFLRAVAPRFSWRYSGGERGCAGASLSFSCANAGPVTVDELGDPRATVKRRGDVLALHLEALDSVNVGAASGSYTGGSGSCEEERGAEVFRPASGFSFGLPSFMPQMLSVDVSVPLAALRTLGTARKKAVTWHRDGLHLAEANRPPLDCNTDYEGVTCSENVRWVGTVEITRARR